MNALHAFAFGVTLAIAIGPIALLIIHNGINHGLLVAVRSGMGAAAADFIYALLAFTVGGAIVTALTSHAQVIRSVSACILIAIGAWLAWKALHSQTTAAANGGARGRGLPPGFWLTFGLTLANPLTLVIFMGFAGQLSPGGDRFSALCYSASVFFGSLVVQMALAMLGASIGKWLANARVIAMLNFASGIAIAAFGIRGLIAAG